MDGQTFDNFLPYYQKGVTFTPPGPDRAANATALFNVNAFTPSGEPLQVRLHEYIRVKEL